MKNRLIRRGIIVVALLATLPGMPVVAAQTLDEAVAAYERGDYATAIRGFRKAADQGNAVGQVNLGHAYAEGRGAPQDYQEALKWYRKAAEQGYVPAQIHLGILYFEGRIVPQNYQDSVKWFRAAADQGDALGQFNLGHMYRLGHGVAQDYFQAHKWFNLAASLTTGEVVDHSRLARDNLAEVMTASQVYEAQRLAREWQPKTIGPETGPLDMNTLKKALEWSLGRDGPAVAVLADDGNVHTIGSGVTMPQILHQTTPSYTKDAIEAKVQGKVHLQAVIRKNGRVDSFKVLSGLGYGLEEKAIQEISSRWRFRPGTLNGRPVDVLSTFEVQFNLR